MLRKLRWEFIRTLFFLILKPWMILHKNSVHFISICDQKHFLENRLSKNSKCLNHQGLAIWYHGTWNYTLGRILTCLNHIEIAFLKLKSFIMDCLEKYFFRGITSHLETIQGSIFSGRMIRALIRGWTTSILTARRSFRKVIRRVKNSSSHIKPVLTKFWRQGLVALAKQIYVEMNWIHLQLQA